MATSAASKPFTVKGTRWMCTVRFVAFFWRQRGWAWVFVRTKARRRLRMAAPCAFSIDAQPRGVALCLSRSICHGCVACVCYRLPICQACVVELEMSSSPGSRRWSQTSRPSGTQSGDWTRWGLCPDLAGISARAQFETAALKRAHSRRCYTSQAAHSTPVSHPSHCRRKPP